LKYVKKATIIFKFIIMIYRDNMTDNADSTS